MSLPKKSLKSKTNFKELPESIKKDLYEAIYAYHESTERRITNIIKEDVLPNIFEEIQDEMEKQMKKILSNNEEAPESNNEDANEGDYYLDDPREFDRNGGVKIWLLSPSSMLVSIKTNKGIRTHVLDYFPEAGDCDGCPIREHKVDPDLGLAYMLSNGEWTSFAPLETEYENWEKDHQKGCDSETISHYWSIFYNMNYNGDPYGRERVGLQ